MSGPCLSSSVAGRPLRPATRRSLGEPLPHQLADRAQANRKAAFAFDLAITCGINPSFPGLSHTFRNVTYVLRTRLPLSISILLPKCSVRLACLIHAASVRSEPESNSPKELVPMGQAYINILL